MSKSVCFLLDGNLSQVIGDILNPNKMDFLGFKLSPGLVTAYIFMLVIIFFASIIRVFFIPKFKRCKTPGKLQIFLEYMVTYFDTTTIESVHKHANFVGPYVFTSAAFISITTLAELLGFTPTFSSINACVAFGLMTFIIINISGIRQFGIIKRAKRLFNPINIVTDAAVPLSLSLRLFGAITSGYIIIQLIYSSLYTSIVLPAVVSVITTLFHALIQAYLFATLSTVFVSEAVEIHT